MKTSNNIDDLFREALSGYRIEPSIGLWRRIERRFFPPSRFRPSGLITSIFLLIIAGSMPWVLIPANHPEPKQPELNLSGAQVGYLINTATLPADGSDTPAGNTTGKAFSLQPVLFEGLPAAIADDPEPLLIASANDPAEDLSMLPWFENNNIIASAEPIQEDESLQNFTDRWIYRMTSLRTGMMNPDFISAGMLSVKNPDLRSSFSDKYEDHYVRQLEVSYGLNFNPSVVFYDPNPYNRMIGAEGILQYKISNLSLRTGVGYSRMADVGTYRINYSSYDSVGFFMNVVSFYIDPRNPGHYIYITRQEAIYDSVEHFTISEKTNYYDYIDVPLSFGYTFLQMNRITLTAYTGIRFSFLVHKTEPTVEFSVTNGELTGIERQVPVRLNTNWRFTAGLNFGYTLTDQVSLHLEPVFEQYISPIYADQPGYQTRKPMVTGIKAGVMFNF